MTLQQRYARYLEARGFTRDMNARTGKYWRYIRSDLNGSAYFLGSGGAVRYSVEGRITQSFDRSAYIKAEMVGWEKAQGLNTTKRRSKQ